MCDWGQTPKSGSDPNMRKGRLQVAQNQGLQLGSLQAIVDQSCRELESTNAIKRLWERDPLLWKEDPAHQKVIKNRLGWLTSVDWLIEKTDELLDFQKEITKEGFKDVVLLGMGGSSMAPEVFRRTFGHLPGKPRLTVLDSTDPNQVLHVESDIELSKTLFIVSTNDDMADKKPDKSVNRD